MKRPLGVTILAGLDYFSAVYCIVFAIAALMGPDALIAMQRVIGSTPHAPDFYTQGFRVAFACFFLGLAAFGCVLGRALWKLQNWARILTLAGSVIELVFVRSYSSQIQAVLYRAIAVATLIYLLNPRVRDAFKKATLTDSPAAA